MPDHLHFFVGLNPKQSISDMMRLAKSDSSEFVNNQKFTQRKFYWQDGYGAFSNSRTQIDAVVKYIMNQKQHHSKKTFREEYLDILRHYAIEYDEKYIFHDLLDGWRVTRTGQEIIFIFFLQTGCPDGAFMIA